MFAQAPSPLLPVRTILFILTCLAACLLSSRASFGADGAAASPTRLAIISNEEAADLAALLTSAISKRSSYHLLERDELDRIGDERALVSMALAESERLGKLEGSDGLLLLTREDGQYRARLTAVHLGYAVFDLIYAREASPEELVQSLSSHLERLAGKLALGPEKAIPLAVLNLRADNSSPEAIPVERNATLLLESYLSQIPEAVVLERREPAALSVERALSPESPELLHGLFLIDGSLTLSLAGDGLTASLRIRAPQGSHVATLEVTGSRSDLPAFAKELVREFAAAMKLAPPIATALPDREAREYLLEGIWAFRRGLYTPALSALDSAELLGETASDLLAIRIPTLCHLAATFEAVTRDSEPLPDSATPGPAIAHLQRAIVDLRRYKETNGQKKLELLNPRQTFDGRTGELNRMVSICGFKMQAMLDRTAHPIAARFRTELRAFVGYDPFHGGIPPDPIAAIGYAGHLSTSLEEELAFYRTLSTDLRWAAYHAWRMQIDVKPDTFCSRFIPAGEERRQAFFAFWKSLLDDPVARPAALFYFALWAAPEEKENACERFYRQLWESREDLFATRRLPYLLKYAFKIEKARTVTTASPYLIDTLLYLLNIETPFKGPLEGSWNPELFPSERAAELWQAMQGYQKRIAARGAGTGYFQNLNQLFTERFGEPGTMAGQAEAFKELLVTRFWQPADLTEMFLFNGDAFSASSRGVLIAGHSGGSKGSSKVYRIALPRLEGTEIDPPAPFVNHMAIEHGDALFLLGHEAGTAVIWRYGFPGGEWTRFPVPSGTSRLFSAGGKIYLVMDRHFEQGNESAVSLFDPETGATRLLASSRRRPAQNQFDEARSFRIESIFEGPGGDTYAVFDSRAYRIREEPGEWPLMNWGFVRQVTRQETTALLQCLSFSEESASPVLAIDPLHDTPRVLIGPAVLASPRSKTAPAPDQWPEWSRNSVWPTGTKIDETCQQFGLRGDDVIGLQTQSRNGTVYDLLYYRKNAQSPVRIRLQFRMPPPELEILKRTINPSDDTFEGITDPRPFGHACPMYLTPEGICIRALQQGFWFIPYSDLDAALSGFAP